MQFASRSFFHFAWIRHPLSPKVFVGSASWAPRKRSFPHRDRQAIPVPSIDWVALNVISWLQVRQLPPMPAIANYACSFVCLTIQLTMEDMPLALSASSLPISMFVMGLCRINQQEDGPEDCTDQLWTKPDPRKTSIVGFAIANSSISGLRTSCLPQRIKAPFSGTLNWRSPLRFLWGLLGRDLLRIGLMISSNASLLLVLYTDEGMNHAWLAFSYLCP